MSKSIITKTHLFATTRHDFTLGETLAWVRKRNKMNKPNWFFRQVSPGASSQNILPYLTQRCLF